MNRKTLFWLISAALSLVPLFYILRFSPEFVNTDRLGILNPYFLDESVFEGFFYKHGPHYLGLSHLISRLFIFLFGFSPTIDLVSGWFSIVLLFSSAVKLVSLSNPDGFNFSYYYLPLSIFSLAPCLGLVILPHVHVMLPLFAIWLSLTGFVENDLQRVLLRIVLIFVGIFSGFAYLAVIAFIIIESVSLVKKRSRGDFYILNLFVFMIGMTIFISLMKFDSNMSNVGLDFNLSYFVDVLRNGLGGALNFFGLLTLLIAVIFWIRLFVLSKKTKPSIFHTSSLIIAFSVLLFVIASYAGRGLNMPDAGLADRYYHTLWLIPFSFYLWFINISSKKRVKTGWVVLGILALTVPIPTSFEQGKWFKQFVNKWMACYQETDNIYVCNDKFGFNYVPSEKLIAPYKSYLYNKSEKIESKE